MEVEHFIKWKLSKAPAGGRRRTVGGRAAFEVRAALLIKLVRMAPNESDTAAAVQDTKDGGESAPCVYLSTKEALSAPC